MLCRSLFIYNNNKNEQIPKQKLGEAKLDKNNFGGKNLCQLMIPGNTGFASYLAAPVAGVLTAKVIKGEIDSTARWKKTTSSSSTPPQKKLLLLLLRTFVPMAPKRKREKKNFSSSSGPAPLPISSIFQRLFLVVWLIERAILLALHLP